MKVFYEVASLQHVICLQRRTQYNTEKTAWFKKHGHKILTLKLWYIVSFK